MAIAPGRPDSADLARALGFGQEVAARIRSGAGGRLDTPLALPGDRPFKDLRVPLGVAPALDERLCADCGACATVCPTGAIAMDRPRADASLCIQCCACIRACPFGARSTVDPRVLQIAERLHRTCGERKEPRLFF